jgi:hypothetical protein
MWFGSGLFSRGYKRLGKSPWMNDLSEEQRKELETALKLSDQLAFDLHNYQLRLIDRVTTVYSLTCQNWMSEHPEVDLFNELASSLSHILSTDNLELRGLELEMKQFKFARRKWDEDKLEIILERYRDDRIEKFVADIISLNGPTEWKQWQEACIDKGLDLESWKRVRKNWVPEDSGHSLSYQEVLLSEFVGQRKAIQVFRRLFKRAS